MALQPTSEIELEQHDVNLADPVARTSSSISTGLGPSALTIRSRSLWAISGSGSERRPLRRGRQAPGQSAQAADQDRRQRLDDIARARHEAGALLDEIVGAGRARVEGAARHGEDLASLLPGETGGDQGARAFGGFHHHPQRDA